MKIFISYCRDDLKYTETLAHDLAEMTHVPWYDKEIKGGENWWNSVLTQIRECDLFIYILSKKSWESKACSKEYNYADALGKNILPVRIDPNIPINQLPDALSIIQMVDYQNPDEKTTIFKLQRALKNLPPTKALPTPLPKPPDPPISYLSRLTQQIESEKNLTKEEQNNLISSLRHHAYNNPDETSDVIDSLMKFRKREDLLNLIAEEIDGLLKDLKAGNSHDRHREQTINQQFPKKEQDYSHQMSYPAIVFPQPMKKKGISKTAMTIIGVVVSVLCLILISVLSYLFDFLFYGW